MLNKWRAKRALKLRNKAKYYDEHIFISVSGKGIFSGFYVADYSEKAIKLKRKADILEMKIFRSLEQGCKCND